MLGTQQVTSNYLIWWLRREGNGTPLQYSCLENPMDRGAWWAAVYGAAQSRTRLKRLSSSSSWWLRYHCSPGGASDQTPTFQSRRHENQARSLCQEDPLEKETATHSSTHAWRIPGTEEPEPGRLQPTTLQNRTRLKQLGIIITTTAEEKSQITEKPKRPPETKQLSASRLLSMQMH